MEVRSRKKPHRVECVRERVAGEDELLLPDALEVVHDVALVRDLMCGRRQRRTHGRVRGRGEVGRVFVITGDNGYSRGHRVRV